MILTTRLQRYIFKSCFSAFTLVTGIIAIAILVVDGVEQLRTVGTRVDVSLFTAMKLSVLKLPMLIEQTLPFAVMTACMLAFNRLSRRAELPVIRASGMSAWRFTAPALAMAMVTGVVATIGLNPLGARLNTVFEAERAALLAGDGPNDADPAKTLFLRDVNDDRQIMIRAGSVSETGNTLNDVVFIVQERRFEAGAATDDFSFSRRLTASTATLASGFWQLQTFEEMFADKTTRGENLAIESALDAESLADRFAPPSLIGFWNLSSFIETAREAGLDVARYEVRQSQLTAAPAAFAAMAMIGCLTFLKLARLGGATRAVALGFAAASGLFFIAQFTASLGATGALPPAVAAWAPPLFALFSTFAVLSWLEDG